MMAEQRICITCGISYRPWCGIPRCWDCHDLRECIKRWGKGSAHLHVRKAVVAGLLPPAYECECVDCGRPACDYDHRDYSKPLAVEPVCRSCNTKRGPGKHLDLSFEEIQQRWEYATSKPMPARAWVAYTRSVA